MKRTRFTEEQILQVLKEGEAGVEVAEIFRKFGISASSYHRWKSRYGGMEISELRRMKSLELENEQLKRLVADLSLDAVYLKAALAKKY